MDFLSLFDPADGNQTKPKKRYKEPDTVKKKPDVTIKGRRRGRRANGKNETLPEESSFLCEPDLSTDILVKHGSYIDCYIEVNEPSAEPTPDEKKPKKRHNGRKTRRRKKISPKELPFEKIYTNNLNNNTVIPKICDENVGKNVNDLTSEFKTSYRIDSDGVNGNAPRDGVDSDGVIRDTAVYNVIDKLEKVSLKDNMYLAGDFTAQDLESDFFYCSDDDDYDDDSTDEGDESSSSVGGSLPPEPRFGNVEYKLRLSAQCERRFQHLVTQLKWRLVSGGGSCVYVIGVRDCGALVGLSARALRGSLRALRRMAGALHAHIAHLTARRVMPHRAVAEVYIKKLAHPQQSIELRVAVMGANEAGKSTLIGVLTQGELDNGNGSARLNMFRHQHEVKTGMTSSLSHEILGFDAQGNVVNYGCSELMTAERIGERSAKLVSFLDLAGHTKYQRTTRHGLTGYSPHAAMLVISATAGITPITEEHMGILLALRLPFFIVINKCELASTAVSPLLERLALMLEHYDKKPLLITDESLARNCCGPQKLILDSIDETPGQKQDEPVLEQVAVFPVSCVLGFGLNSLHAHLLALQPPSDPVETSPEEETCEFQIDEIFHVGDSSDPVVGGLLARGQLFEGDRLLIGPLDDGSFKLVGVRSIYRNRVPSGTARAGQPASLGLVQPCPPVRPGMVLLAVPAGYKSSKRRVWGGCEPHKCKRRLEMADVTSKPVIQTTNLLKANKNLLQHIARAEQTLTKEIDSKECNLYRESDSEEETDRQTNIHESDDQNDVDCVCPDRVLLEDSSDPRGCLFFQATVHLIRHSTGIHAGFQCTVHVGNVRQTAIIEGIMTCGGVVRAGETASALFRFVRCPEYLQRGRQMLLAAGLGTRGIGRITQIFPYVP